MLPISPPSILILAVVVVVVPVATVVIIPPMPSPITASIILALHILALRPTCRLPLLILHSHGRSLTTHSRPVNMICSKGLMGVGSGFTFLLETHPLLVENQFGS